jgi:hypothetical protein
MFQDWNTCVKDGVATLQCLPIVFQNVVAGFLLFSGVTLLFLLAYGGIKLGISGGDPKQVAAAKGIITWGIVGLIIVLSSFAIIYFIAYLTKTTAITEFTIPGP